VLRIQSIHLTSSMQNSAIIATMQRFMPGFNEEEMELRAEEFEQEALGMYIEHLMSSRTAPKARKAAAGGGSSAPRKRTKKAAPRPLIELPPSYEEDGRAAAAGSSSWLQLPLRFSAKCSCCWAL
jgi:hypothetical protein